MGGAVTPQFVSAVANHGGLGMLPLGKWSLEDCETLINETLELTDKVIGVNLILDLPGFGFIILMDTGIVS